MADVLAVLVATLAVALAAWQFRWTVRQTRLKTTFEQIREVTALIQQASHYDYTEISAVCLQFYNRQVAELTDGAAALVTLLNALDLLCFAIAKDEVDGEIVKVYLSSALNPLVPELKSHIRELRRCFRDDSLYLHLYDLLPEFSTLRHRR